MTQFEMYKDFNQTIEHRGGDMQFYDNLIRVKSQEFGSGCGHLMFQNYTFLKGDFHVGSSYGDSEELIENEHNTPTFT